MEVHDERDGRIRRRVVEELTGEGIEEPLRTQPARVVDVAEDAVRCAEEREDLIDLLVRRSISFRSLCT